MLGKAGSNLILFWIISKDPLNIYAVFSITNLELLLYLIVFFPFIFVLSLIFGFKLILNLIAEYGWIIIEVGIFLHLLGINKFFLILFSKLYKVHLS